MSRFLLVAIAVVSVHSVAFANNTVCAGSNTYYRFLQADSGIMHMPATWLIFATLGDGSRLNYTVNADALPSRAKVFALRRLRGNRMVFREIKDDFVLDPQHPVKIGAL